MRRDPLTGCINRRGAEEVLGRELLRRERSGESMAAVLVDLDDFKSVNDSLGHAAGDLVLTTVAEAMQRTARSIDFVCRIGGDEFLIFLPNTRLAEARLVAERMRQAVADSGLSIARSEKAPWVTASMGVVSLEGSANTIEEILTACHSLLKRSKARGKNRVSASIPSMGPASPFPPDSSPDLSPITRFLSGEIPLKVVSQAVYELKDETPVGCELLIRGAGALTAPSDLFRAAAEEDALIALDMTCFRTCLEYPASSPKVHVNLLPSTLLGVASERLVDMCARHAPHLFIDISEQEFIGVGESLRSPIAKLRAAGIRIALENVGFGRSSLETLILTEPDSIKIDRSLVSRIDTEPSRRRALDRLLKVLRSFESEIIAVGVETRGELAVLRDLGIPFAQGFLWGVPS